MSSSPSDPFLHVSVGLYVLSTCQSIKHYKCTYHLSVSLLSVSMSDYLLFVFLSVDCQLHKSATVFLILADSILSYRITSHRTACRYGMNFTRVLLYLEVQWHAVVNEGILPATQVAHPTKSNIFLKRYY